MLEELSSLFVNIEQFTCLNSDRECLNKNKFLAVNFHSLNSIQLPFELTGEKDHYT